MGNGIHSFIQNRKGQVFSTDVGLSVIIFLIMVVFLFSLWNLYAQQFQENTLREEMELLAFQITDLLVKTPGIPNNWEELASSGAQVNQNTIGNYKLDEGSGQTVTDDSGNSNGVLGSSSDVESTDPSWASGTSCFSGACLSFDGSDDFVTIPHSPKYTNLQNFTIEMWIYPTQDKSSQEEHLISKNNQWYIKIVKGMKPSFLINGVGQFTPNYVFQLNTWYHIALTNQHSVVAFTPRNNITFYVNGEPVFNDAGVVGTPASSSDPIYLGRQGLPQNYFPGRMDLTIFSSAAKATFNLDLSSGVEEINSAGLAAKGRELSDAKVHKFFSLQYGDLKSLFNVERFETQISLLYPNGTVINQTGLAPSDESTQQVSVRRLVLQRQEPREVRVLLWSE